MSCCHEVWRTEETYADGYDDRTPLYGVPVARLDEVDAAVAIAPPALFELPALVDPAEPPFEVGDEDEAVWTDQRVRVDAGSERRLVGPVGSRQRRRRGRAAPERKLPPLWA